MSSFEGYNAIAGVYDKLNADIDYKAWADFFESCFDRFLATRPEIILDLACGTGRMARELSSVASYAVTLRPDNPRSLDTSLYAEEFRKCSVEAYASESIPDAVRHAVRTACERNLPIVSLGSLYMYGDVKRALFALFPNTK